MEEFDFVIDKTGRKKAVIIDLKKHGQFWEDSMMLGFAIRGKMIRASRTSRTSRLETLKRSTGLPPVYHDREVIIYL